MKILFRYDDLSETSDLEFDMEIIEAMVNEGFKPMIGIIPSIADINWEIGNHIPLRKLSVERIKIVRQFTSKHIDLALHGYTHQAITGFSGMSEFGDGVSYKLQLDRLIDGKKFLEDSFGKELSWFIPPWNAYGVNTINALKEIGFKGISADASYGLTDDRLIFAPQTCQLQDLNQAIYCSKKDVDSYIIVMLHQYDFNKVNMDNNKMNINTFSTLLKKLKEQITSDSTFDSLLENEQFDASRARMNQEIRKLTQGPMRILAHTGTQKIYWGEKSGNAELARLIKLSKFMKMGMNLIKR
jgi:peptidoglycan/xylan/chitin deacetylase (PgdA/CDA1 family)